MMRRWLGVTRLWGVGSLAVLAVLAAAPAASPRDGRAAAGVEATDILLAFDTTGSMAPSIAAAQRDAETILSVVGGFAPNARFAVASFRDRFYPGGSYTLVTPMTPDEASLTAAIAKLKAVKTTDSSKDTLAEAYNLLFRKTYTDSRIGWRSNSRKIVVVIGDAEPHSAGAEGVQGCADRTRDWDGLSTSRELAAMRAARRTLVMIRQVQTASTSLACYSSLASLGFEGGAARDSGSRDIAVPVLNLVKQAFAPFTITPQLTRAVRGRTNGLTVRIANPNSFPLSIAQLSHRLPAGVRLVPRSASGALPRPTAAGGLHTWRVAKPLEPFHAVVGHVVLRSGSARSIRLVADTTVTPPDGRRVQLQAKAAIRLVGRARRASIAADGVRGAASIRGAATVALPGAGTRSTGTIVARSSGSRSVTVRPTAVTASRIGAPASLRLGVTVLRATGYPACRRGSSGTAQVFDSDGLTLRLATRDRLTLVLPAACGGTRRFADAAGGRLSLKLGFL
jgi:hypothetical protein